MSMRTASARLDHVAVALEQKADAVEATVTLDLATDSRDWLDTTLSIAVPPGTVATALVLDSEGGTSRGRTLAIGEARAEYDEALRIKRDPALLEQVGTNLVLHVFPIVRDAPATVHVYLRLPKVATLSVRAGKSPVDIALDGGPAHAAHAVVLPVRDVHVDWMTEDPTTRVAVDHDIALFAGPPDRSGMRWFHDDASEVAIDWPRRR